MGDWAKMAEVEGNTLISSCKSTKITTSYRKTDRRTLELTKKDTHVKDKTVGGGAIMINQIPFLVDDQLTGWRKNNTKESL